MPGMLGSPILDETPSHDLWEKREGVSQQQDLKQSFKNSANLPILAPKNRTRTRCAARPTLDCPSAGGPLEEGTNGMIRDQEWGTTLIGS
eukprot:s247_g9.t1